MQLQVATTEQYLHWKERLTLL